MDDLKIKDPAGNDVGSFFKTYRDSIKQQYDMANSKIRQDNRLKEASIMSNANKAGVMFSNFPQRMKLQNLSNAYLPALAKTHDTYQTGLQKLRADAVGAYNNIKNMQDAINNMNKMPGAGYGGSGYGGSAGKYGAYKDAHGGVQFYNNATGNPVRFGTYFKNAGGTFDQGTIQDAVGQVFGTNSNEYKRISDIFKYNPDKAVNHLSGGTTQQYDRGFLSQEDEDLLNRLGFGM